MEKIIIPKVGCILDQFQKIDKYKWYSSILKHHATDSFSIKGIPAPIYVAQKMSQLQEQDNFGVTDMKDLLIPLVNTAFLLNCQTDSFEFRPKFKATFSECIAKTFLAEEKALKKMLKVHCAYIDSLRTIQRKKQSDRHEAELKNLRGIMKKEEKLRTAIMEKVEEIKKALTSMIWEGLNQVYMDLCMAVNTSSKYGGFDMVIEQLRKFDVGRTVGRLLKLTSATYTTPLPTDFIKAADCNEKVSKVSYKRCEFKEFGYNTDSLFKGVMAAKAGFPHEAADENCYEDCFFPRSGGIYLPSRKYEIPKGHGTMNVKPGYQIKMKLSLMNGTAGFGWNRRNNQGTKKWGFFYISVDDSSKQIPPKTGAASQKTQTHCTGQKVECDKSIFLASKFKNALQELSPSSSIKNEDSKIIEDDLVLEEI